MINKHLSHLEVNRLVFSCDSTGRWGIFIIFQMMQCLSCAPLHLLKRHTFLSRAACQTSCCSIGLYPLKVWEPKAHSYARGGSLISSSNSVLMRSIFRVTVRDVCSDLLPLCFSRITSCSATTTAWLPLTACLCPALAPVCPSQAQPQPCWTGRQWVLPPCTRDDTLSAARSSARTSSSAV